jgi:hypothetical protein
MRHVARPALADVAIGELAGIPGIVPNVDQPQASRSEECCDLFLLCLDRKSLDTLSKIFHREKFPVVLAQDDCNADRINVRIEDIRPMPRRTHPSIVEKASVNSRRDILSNAANGSPNGSRACCQRRLVRQLVNK